MSGRPWKKLPFQPLEDYLGGDNRSEWARRTSTDRANLLHWRRQGWLSVTTAERMADRMQVHPSQIWPTYGEAAS